MINTIHYFLLSVDTRDYAAMRTCLTDEVNFDYSALFGTSMPSKADELVERVRADHTGLRSVQHIVTNHYVTINDATAQCNVNISVSWTEGNLQIFDLARQTGA